MTTRHTLWVPSYFFDDHYDRSPSDDGSDGICTIVRASKYKVLINGTNEQIECLRSDAEYYCDKWGPDEAHLGLKRSAAATIRAIAKYYESISNNIISIG